MLAFDETAIGSILETIEERGFAIVSPAFQDGFIARVCRLIEQPFRSKTVNGELGFVQYGCRRFLKNPLTWGKEIIDVYTNPVLIELCERYSGSPVHLTSYRIYQTYASRSDRMDWHVDNKTMRLDENTGVSRTVIESEEKSLSAMLFLTNVVDGGLEVVSGSNKWSQEMTLGRAEMLNEWENEFREKVVTCNGLRRGAMILFDIELSIERDHLFLGRYGWCCWANINRHECLPVKLFCLILGIWRTCPKCSGAF